MKGIKLFVIAMCVSALASCNGGGDAQQAAVPVAPTAQPQPAQPAVTDTAMAQPAAQQAQVPTQALPEAVTAFINQYFPGAAVSGVETDNEYGGIEYEVYLNDGSKVEFDTRNQWEKVECPMKSVPAALVPQTIANYVKTNYQSLPITKIHKKPYGYEIDLSNGAELRFNPQGQFMGFDD